MEGDTLEGYNIRVVEILPYDDLPAKCLKTYQDVMVQLKVVRMRYLFELRHINVYPKLLDTNVYFVEGPSVDVSGSTRGDRPHGTK